LALSLTALPAAAQEDEEDPTLDGMGKWFLELGVWIPQPTGLDLVPATRLNPSDPWDTRGLNITPSTDSRFRYQGGIKLNKNIGEIVFTWFSHQDRTSRNESSPGRFLYGEALVTPYYAGLYYDGLADGFSAESFLKTRELRLDFCRDAFSYPRISGKWFVGYRRVSHHRRLSSDYFALVSGLPPLVPPLTDPRPDLDPGVDSAQMFSDVTVRGGEAGIEVQMPLVAKKAWVEAGFAIAVLRGRASTDYSATTYRYAMTDSGAFLYVLDPPFDEFGVDTDPADPDEGALVDDIVQQRLDIGFRSNNESINSQALEMFLGLRWKIWKDMEVFAGYRSVRYPNLGVELRQMDAIPMDLDPPVGEDPVFNIPAPTRVEHDLNYEGYYAGLAYSF
jgi:hypothetical protein